MFRRTVSILLMFILVFSTAFAAATDISKKCKYWVSEGEAEDFTDASIKTGWKPRHSDAELRIALPENAGYVSVDWLDDPTGYVFTQYDANRSIITQLDRSQSFVGINQLFRLEPEARYASLKLTKRGQAVQQIRVYSRGELPLSVKDFQPAHEKCDLMVVSTHQDDEWIFFGGIIPYYEYVREKKVQLVYMADCGRLRKNEALNGLWAGGVRNHPLFIDLVDEKISSLNKSLEHWGGKKGLTSLLVAAIRKFKPEVILTHDINGEYGHNQHKLTSRAMETAIKCAADPSMFPKSAEKFGVWQVKKLYLHLSKDNAIRFNWHVQYDQLRGYTPFQVAKIAYSKHVSQQEAYQVEDGGKYDNALFGLTYSTVGKDVERKDLFENLDPTPTPIPTATPTPEPTAEPTPVPTAEPTAEPTPVPTPEPTATAEPLVEMEYTDNRGKTLALIIGAVVLAAAAGAVLMLYPRKRRKARRRKNKHRR